MEEKYGKMEEIVCYSLANAEVLWLRALAVVSRKIVTSVFSILLSDLFTLGTANRTDDMYKNNNYHRVAKRKRITFFNTIHVCEKRQQRM